ncbi:MAG TPA: heavy metal transporter [Clostridiales bacterium]|nr:heavy metal transporter [Clostridiales bacterium]
MKKVIALQDLDCANCAAKMECAVKKVEGVSNANVNFLMQKMTVEIDSDQPNAVLAEIKKVCKKVEPDCVLKI